MENKRAFEELVEVGPAKVVSVEPQEGHIHRNQDDTGDGTRDDRADRYDKLFSLANDVMLSYDNQFRLLRISPNIERVLGYKPEELVGKTFLEAGILHPDYLSAALKNSLMVLSGKTLYSTVYPFIAKDGTIRFGELNGVPIIREGKVEEVISVARDITDRIAMEKTLKESEERYRTTLESLPDAVSILRLDDCRYLYVNEAFSRITGYTAEETLGRSPFDMDLPELPGDTEILRAIMSDGMPVNGVFCNCRGKDGSIIDTLISARPVTFDNSSCMSIVMTDITDIRRVEEEKRILELRSQKMESLGTLSRGIAHDFNNLLTTIVGYTRMSMKGISGLSKDDRRLDSVRNDLAEVQKAALRARDLVNQILAFSRHTGKEHIPFDMGNAVKESLKILRPVLPRTINIVSSIEANGRVMGDPAQIHQVIMNLCTNAVYAMRDTEGEIEVSLRKTTFKNEDCAVDPEMPVGPCFKLSVRDSGRGMTPRVMSRIFDPYFTTRDNEQGAGLGLSVVHGIVKSHGGVIFCTSEPGIGTTFDIFIPEIEQETDAASQGLETFAKPHKKPRRIVLNGGKTSAGPVDSPGSKHIRKTKQRPGLDT